MSWLAPAEVKYIPRPELERAYEEARSDTLKWMDTVLVLTRAVKLLEQQVESLRKTVGPDRVPNQGDK